MSLLNKLLIYGTYHYFDKKNNTVRDQKIRDEQLIKVRIRNIEREQAVDAKRKQMPCLFKDGISYIDFTNIANKAAKKIRRINEVSVTGAVIKCKVQSQTGYTNWHFEVDFNNWGHITERHWTVSENQDSSIPEYYSDLIIEQIQKIYDSKGLSLPDFSFYVDRNKDLETADGLEYRPTQFLHKRFLHSPIRLSLNFDSDDLIGEHLYLVVSRLRASGFKNIRTFAIEDVDFASSKYCYQVEQVVIAGTGYFERKTVFLETDEIIVTYHQRKVSAE